MARRSARLIVLTQTRTRRKMLTSGTGKGKKAVAVGGKEKREKCAWPVEDTTEFLNLIKANKKLGGPKMSYKPEFWTMIDNQGNGAAHDKGRSKECKSIEKKGVDVNEASQVVWNDTVEGNPKKDINQFKNSGWAYFDLMQEMMPEHATGVHAFRASQNLQGGSVEGGLVSDEDNNGVMEGDSDEEVANSMDIDQAGGKDSPATTCSNEFTLVPTQKSSPSVKSSTVRPPISSASNKSGEKRKIASVEGSAVTESVVTGTSRSKSARLSGAAALNGLKEQMQRSNNIQESQGMQFISIVKKMASNTSITPDAPAAPTPSTHVHTNDNDHPSIQKNARSLATKRAQHLERWLDDKRLVAFLDLLRLKPDIVEGYMDLEEGPERKGILQSS
ncbi:hypothetical protein SERLA73DRAFT_73373 [Serpula lacrymans var. lacrymans S7.3]|uniref:Uncharacterized protein n=2 Tax=Serpula lacrymans var. lacrymans TaxID=341189 RepID=F8PY17_SERL3|nr:uncharacterized protein SERLADRAFT_437983 [Serpula lacrymans var. lacrymans S7.9]EGN98780.1 hypothetical protein SERLA73DRAFT_73373 [Serpula lacrymans var. lacrymans S7.3]EGO24375.1 hypothetical protein SERLADRAFT_437983 [Serpula lacrymans var. lacrymans S7.9]